LVSAYLAELREMIDAVRAANDPAFGATAHVERIAEHLVRGLGTFIAFTDDGLLGAAVFKGPWERLRETSPLSYVRWIAANSRDISNT
jgi:hypothetical protein